MNLRSLFLIPVLVAIPLLLIPPLVVYWQANGQLAESSRQQAALSAQMSASGVQHWVERQIATAEIVVKDIDLARLLQSATPQEIEQKSRDFGYLFPDSIRVRLLQPGIAHEDTDASPPITFAAVDMIRAAETSEKQPDMEVHASGTPQQHINLVRRVLDPSGKRIAGHLMVSFPVQGLQRILDSSNVPGFTELQQVAGGGALGLAARGDVALRKSSSDDGNANVRGSRWKVSYWSPGGSETNRSMMLYSGLAAALLIAGILLPLAFFLYGKLAKGLRQDQATCLDIIKDMREQRVKRTYTTVIPELNDTIELMARTAREGILVKQAVQAAPSKVVQPDVVDEVESDLLFDSSPLDVARSEQATAGISPTIFRAYDIRGIVNETLTKDVVYQLGRAIGSEAYFRGEQTIVVARDGRLSGPDLADALIQGLKSTGRDVKNIGQVPTPVLYFATHSLGTNSGVMLTGSHNPPDYNGLKIVLGGETLTSDAIQELRKRIEMDDLLAGEGTVEEVSVLDDYVERIKSDIHVVRPVKVVVDCGNGVAGEAAPRVLKALGCEVVELYCDIDGNFPNHHPDPSRPENLSALIEAVQDNNAELGLAFDGDGDRLGVVTSTGAVIWPDRLMMLFAADVLSRNPGAQIIYDVKCSRNLARIISENGGEPLMWKTGHSLIKAKMKQTGALLAGEMSGHIFFKERWFGFDDAMYSAARLLEIIANDPRASSDIFADLPDSVNTPELNVAMAEGEPAVYMEKLRSHADFQGAQVATIDGIRAEFERGWGLVRASNTTPCLVLRFEAEDELALFNIQEEFRRVMLAADPSISLPF